MSRVLLKFLAVPTKQAFWSNAMIPCVPILLICILRCLLTVPRALITIGIPDLLLFFLSPDSGWSSAILFLLPVHLLYSHTSILFWVMCYQWHSVEQLLSKLWTKRDYSLSTDEVIRLTGSHNCVYINNWRVCQTQVHKSLTGNSLPDTLLSLWDRGGTHPDFEIREGFIQTLR